MKRKNYSLYPLMLTGVMAVFIFSCNKDENLISKDEKVPILTTSAVTSIAGTRASCGGEIISDEGLTVTERGVCWSTQPTVTIADSKTSDGLGAGPFSSKLTGLTPFTTYYIRAYATNSAGTGYGSAMVITTTDLTIGDDFQGGKIGYYFKAGDPGYIAGEKHGLIISSVDQSTGIRWHNGTNILTNASSLLLGAGAANTNAIVSAQGAGSYAARICYDLVLGGYSDWYLPSFYDLHNISANRTVIGGFTSNRYWTSTEAGTSDAVYINLGDNTANPISKSNLYYVRAVRTF